MRKEWKNVEVGSVLMWHWINCWHNCFVECANFVAWTKMANCEWRLDNDNNKFNFEANLMQSCGMHWCDDVRCEMCSDVSVMMSSSFSSLLFLWENFFLSFDFKWHVIWSFFLLTVLWAVTSQLFPMWVIATLAVVLSSVGVSSWTWETLFLLIHPPLFELPHPQNCHPLPTHLLAQKHFWSVKLTSFYG